MTHQLERRIVSQPVEVRRNPDGTVGVRGYAAVFDYEAYGEVIRSSAFNRTLAQKDDIRLLVNHEGVPLARTKSGALELGVDDKGLWFDAPSLDYSNPRVQELVSAMSRGDIDQCSFAGYFTDTRMVDGVREVLEVKGTDVSVVTYPWYDATETSLTGDRTLDTVALALRSLTAEQRATVWATVDIVVQSDDAEDPAEDQTDPAETDPAMSSAPDDLAEEKAEPAMTAAEARALLGL